LIIVSYINTQLPNVPDNITFQYDGKGRRIGIVEKHGSTILTNKTFVWSREKICQERDGSGVIVTKQFFKYGERIGMSNYYFSQDHLKSVRELVDSSGLVQARYDYDAFGRQVKLSGNLASDFGYTSFYMEPAANLDLSLFRAFDTEKSRWLSRDPLGEYLKNDLNIPTGPDLYCYVRNNSLIYTDPFGLFFSPYNYSADCHSQYRKDLEDCSKEAKKEYAENYTHCIELTEEWDPLAMLNCAQIAGLFSQNSFHNCIDKAVKNRDKCECVGPNFPPNLPHPIP
jgi:RHS repeat-associated protein